MVLRDDAGNAVTTLQFGPACADGGDNDLDYAIDLAADQECISLTDSSERLSGDQPLLASTFPIDVDAAGTITIDPTETDFAQLETCPLRIEGEVWCLGVTLVGTGAPQTGAIDAATGQINIPLTGQLEIDTLTGFPGLAPTCHIGPVPTSLSATDYDETTGSASLVAVGVEVPIVDSCGDAWNDILNAYLSLPGEADISLISTILDSNGNPLLID
jgi:hypothetical protein